jgi:hypothetical protein
VKRGHRSNSSSPEGTVPYSGNGTRYGGVGREALVKPDMHLARGTQLLVVEGGSRSDPRTGENHLSRTRAGAAAL